VSPASGMNRDQRRLHRPEARGQGHALRLVRALAACVLSRQEGRFLHIAETNVNAIALYERLGFKTRRPVTFRGYRTP
jgi:predicted GNAT family acetyltransferase